MTQATGLPASPVQTYLDTLLRELEPDVSGAVADYIPELANADPDKLGLGLATVDGAVYAAGDHDVTFSIQSMSKPFTYALALTDRGVDVVDQHIGVEPTGDAFNSISLEAGTGRPRNPMINAGAIIATSLVHGDRDARILEMYSACAGREL
ncbi:MAG: glutaminase, partial [Solirubrobacteraceae bacterium]|nr:glutaminase [Solirubrobacteraceae bacterium]